MDDAATLVEIESIKQLKARYCRLLDAKDWAAWREIFADDFLGDTSPAGGKVIHGADEFEEDGREAWPPAGAVTAIGDVQAARMTEAPKRSMVSSKRARLSPGSDTCSHVTPTAASFSTPDK